MLWTRASWGRRDPARRKMIALAWTILSVALAGSPAQALQIFSAGMTLPESITLVPAGFGQLGGTYLVPDLAGSKIYVLPATGGSPAVFADTSVLGPAPGLQPYGGVFLPGSWGQNAGNFLVSGQTRQSPPFQAGSLTPGEIYIFNANGVGSALVPETLSLGGLVTPLFAPAGFGTLGGQLIVTEFGSRVFVVAPNGTMTVLTNFGTSLAPFGAAFAPADFGAFAGQLLVSNGSSGATTIDAVKSDGSFQLFATLPLIPGQTGQRQIAFAPPGFLPGYDSSLLFVSTGASTSGGGTVGDIRAIDSAGHVVASLRSDLGLIKFDPRGMLFLSDGSLLINDASDPTLLATAQDFRLLAVPEPGTWVLVVAGSLCLGGLMARGAGRRAKAQRGVADSRHGRQA